MISWFCRLKELIPSVSAKDNVTQLDIILEAIRYIDSLQNRLADKLETGDLELVKMPVNNLKEWPSVCWLNITSVLSRTTELDLQISCDIIILFYYSSVFLFVIS